MSLFRNKNCVVLNYGYLYLLTKNIVYQRQQEFHLVFNWRRSVNIDNLKNLKDKLHTYAYKTMYSDTYLLTFIHARMSTHLNDTCTCICKRTGAYRYENITNYWRKHKHNLRLYSSTDSLIWITVNTSRNHIGTHDRTHICVVLITNE